MKASISASSHRVLPVPEMFAEIEAQAELFSKKYNNEQPTTSPRDLPIHSGDEVPRVSLSSLNSGVIHKGELYLLDKNRKFKSYKFILRCPHLYFFNRRSHYRGGIDLRLYARQILDSNLRPFTLCLTEKNNKHQVVLAAASAADYQVWKEMLRFSFDEICPAQTPADSSPRISASRSNTLSNRPKSLQPASLALFSSFRHRSGSFTQITKATDARLKSPLSPGPAPALAPKSADPLTDDLVNLSHESLDALVQVLFERFSAHSFFTRLGPVLLSLCPHRTPFQLFSHAAMQLYRDELLSPKQLPPHPFTLLNKAFSRLLETQQPVTLHLLGPNVCGHLDPTVLMTDYLMELSTVRHSAPPSPALVQQLNRTEVILGSFFYHNKRTIHCHATSYFFSTTHGIVGAKVEALLFNTEVLTKPLGPDQLNFNIFYELLQSEEHCTTFFLDPDPLAYDYLRPISASPKQKLSSPSFSASSSSSASIAFVHTALLESGIDPAHVQHLFALVAAILHLGNVKPEHVVPSSSPLSSATFSTSTSATASGSDPFCTFCSLAGLKTSQVTSYLMHQSGAVFLSRRHALAAALYRTICQTILAFVNAKMRPPKGALTLTMIRWPMTSSPSAAAATHDEPGLYDLFLNSGHDLAHDLYFHTHFMRSLQLYRREAVYLPPMELAYSGSGIFSRPQAHAPSLSHTIFSELELIHRNPSVTPIKARKQIIAALHPHPRLHPGETSDSLRVLHSDNQSYEYDLFRLIRTMQESNRAHELLTHSMIDLLRHPEAAAATADGVFPAFLRELHALLLSSESPNSYWILGCPPNAETTQSTFFDAELIRRTLATMRIPSLLFMTRQSFPTHVKYAAFFDRYFLLYPHSLRRNAFPERPDEQLAFLRAQTVALLGTTAQLFPGGQRRAQTLSSVQVPLERIFDAIVAGATAGRGAASSLQIPVLVDDLKDVHTYEDFLTTILPIIINGLPEAIKTHGFDVSSLVSPQNEPLIAVQDLDKCMWQDGRTSLFMHINLLEYLETTRISRQYAAARKIQSFYRRYRAYTLCRRTLAALRKVRWALLGYLHRRRYVRLQKATRFLQSYRRMVIQRRLYWHQRADPDFQARRAAQAHETFVQAQALLRATALERQRSAAAFLEAVPSVSFQQRFTQFLALHDQSMLLEFYLAHQQLVQLEDPLAVFPVLYDIFHTFIAEPAILQLTPSECQEYQSKIFSLSPPSHALFLPLESKAFADLATEYFPKYSSALAKLPKSTASTGLMVRQSTMQRLTASTPSRSSSATALLDGLRLAQDRVKDEGIRFLSTEDESKLSVLDAILARESKNELENIFAPNPTDVAASSALTPRSALSSRSQRPAIRRFEEGMLLAETVLPQKKVTDLTIYVASLRKEETFEAYVRENCQRHMVSEAGIKRPITWDELINPQHRPLLDAMHPFGKLKKKAAQDFEDRVKYQESLSTSVNPFSTMDELDQIWEELIQSGVDVDNLDALEQQIDASFKAIQAEQRARKAKIEQQMKAAKNLKEEQAQKRTRTAIFMFNSILHLQQIAKESQPLNLKAIQFFHRHMHEDEALRDEIYIQLIKQTREDPHNNESYHFVKRGWEILAILCGLIAPKTVTKYLCAHLDAYRHPESRLSPRNQSAELVELRRSWADFAWQRLARLLATKNRAFSPGPTELAANLKQIPEFLIRIQTADGHSKGILVDSATSIEEIFASLVAQLHLRDPRGWAIFELVTNLERPLSPGDMISDELSRLELLSSNMDRNKLIDEHGEATFSFLFKRRLHLEPRYLSDDPVENSLLFAQCCTDYLAGKIPLRSHDSLKLAAIKLQYDAGDYDSAKIETLLAEARAKAQEFQSEAGIYAAEILESPLILDLSAYLPQAMINSTERMESEWQQDILALYETLKGTSKEQAKAMFLWVMTETPLFGTKTFQVTHKSEWDMPSDILLGVSIEGISFIDAHSFEIVTQFPLASVHRVTHSRHDLKLRFDSLEELRQRYLADPDVFAGPNGPCQNQDVINLFTKEGLAIAALIEEYLDFLKSESCLAYARSDHESSSPKYLSVKQKDRLKVLKKHPQWSLAINLSHSGLQGLVRTDLLRYVAMIPPHFFADAATRLSVSTKRTRPAIALPTEGEATPQASQAAFDVSTRFVSQKIANVDSARYTMATFATRKFRSAQVSNHTLGRSGKQTMKTLNLGSRLTFSSSSIRDSLLNFTSEAYTKDSARTFEKVMAFMGDARLRHKHTMLSTLRDILMLVIRSKALRDEILCQIIKQTTDNPNQNSVQRGWLLMTFCLATFLPTKDFSRYLIAYIQDHTELVGPLAPIGELARECLLRLGRTLRKGARRNPPSRFEYECIVHRRPLTCRVSLLDGSTKMILIDQACTVGELLSEMFDKLELPPDYHHHFSIFLECEQIDQSHALNPEDNICDILYGCENHPKTRDDPDRFDWRFVFKHQLMFTWSGLFNPEQVEHPVYLQLLFCHALHEIHSEKYGISEATAIALAGYHLQADLGNHTPGSQLDLIKYLPSHQLNAHARDYWMPRVVQGWQSAADLSTKQAREKYIALTQATPFYGATFWHVRRDTKPYDATLALSCRCLAIIDPESRMPIPNHVFSYMEIQRWNWTGKELRLTLGNPADGSIPTILSVHTEHADQIINVLDRYLDQILKFLRAHPDQTQAVVDIHCISSKNPSPR